MDKRLVVQLDNIKLIKDAEDKDVPAVFSLVLPFGVQYSLAYEAIDELKAELKAMDEAAAKLREEKPVEAEIVNEAN